MSTSKELVELNELYGKIQLNEWWWNKKSDKDKEDIKKEAELEKVLKNNKKDEKDDDKEEIKGPKINNNKSKQEYGGEGTKTVYNKDGSKTITKGHSDDLRSDSLGGTKASSDAGKKLLNPDEKSDVGSDGLSAKNKRFTTKTVNVTNRRGRVTGTKEVRVQSQQSDGGKKITNRRGRVIGTTKPTDAEGKSFPSTAEIRAKAKADGGSGLSNIPSKEGNAVINKKPLNPDFGKKPVIQKDTPIKPEISARQKWLNKTSNSPAAKAGLSDDQRWAARQKHVKFQKDNNRGPFRDPNKKAGGRKFNPSNKITSVMDMESYDAYDLVLIHLLETNQVDTIEEANYVMTEMDGKTILEIKRLMESMPAHVRDSIGRQYGTGKYKGEKYTIEDKKNVVNWYSRIKA